MKKAIIYTRFSPRPNAKDCDSCEKQVERCRNHCVQKGYALLHIASDRNQSGGLLSRPGLNTVINMLSSVPGKDKVLVVDSSDRLARDMLVSLTIRHQIEQAGATIEFADGSPQDTTPEGKLFQNILAAFAAYERDRIRLRTKNGLAKKKEAGQWLGKPPVGWKLDPETKQLVECEREQEVIRKILSFDTECPSQAIADNVAHSCGLVRGKLLSARTVRKILKKAREKA